MSTEQALQLVVEALEALSRQQADQAVALLDQALELDPAVRHGEAPARLVRCLVHLDRGDYPLALVDALRLVADAPEDPAGWLAMGRARAAMKDHRRALQAMDRALELRPGWGDAHWHRASSRGATMDLSGAIEDLDQALAHLAEHARSSGREARIYEARAQLLLMAERRDLARQDVIRAAAIWDARDRPDQRDRVISLAKALGL